MKNIYRAFVVAAMLTATTANTIAYAEDSEGDWYAHAQDIWTNSDREFQWYPDGKAAEKESPQAQKQQAQQNELAQFEMLQKQLDSARKVAIMNPTEANLKRYIQLQEMAMNQAATFTDQWQRVIWQNPSLDYSQRSRPTNQLAVQQYDANRQQEKQRAIRELAGQSGILFIFKSDCPYCHAMAPVMQQFASMYNIKVMPVSIDGRGIPGYPSALPDNGIAQRLGVSSVPAVFVMDTKTKEFKPMGFGVMSQTMLEDRFLAFSRPVGTLY